MPFQKNIKAWFQHCWILSKKSTEICKDNEFLNAGMCPRSKIRFFISRRKTSYITPGRSFTSTVSHGDSAVATEVKSVANYLGMAISNQLNSYPMNRLIITGRMLELGPDFQSMLENKIKSNVFSSFRSGLSIHFIRLDYDNSLARGAAIFAERTSRILSA